MNVTAAPMRVSSTDQDGRKQPQLALAANP